MGRDTAMASASIARRSAGLDARRTQFDSGLVLVAKQARATPAVTINLAVRAGSLCDPLDAPGAMYLLSRVLDRGTTSRSADQVAEELDRRGTALTITVTRHLFSLTCTCLAEDFDAVMTLIGEIVMSPAIPEVELATRKREVITAIRQDEDNTAVQAVEGLMALLYPPPHAYGRRSKGTSAVIDGLPRARVVELHRSRFAPAEVSAVVVGDVDPGLAHDVVASVFAGWALPPPPPIAPGPVAPSGARQRRVVPMMNKAQVDIAYGFTTIRRSDPSYYAFWLMNHVLGQYSMAGRLGQSIRERQGMAYYVHSAFEANVVEGPLLVRAGVGPANVDRTVASIDEEIARLVRDGVTEKEMNDSRQYLIYALPRSLETNAGIAAFLQSAEFFGLGLDYDRRLPDLLLGVTLDEINAAARRHLHPDRAAIVIAGPYGEPTVG
jgi:zinc protease